MNRLHERIADDLRNRIRSGDLGVGDAVPSEAQLASQWSVSRAPARQALLTLRNEGLISGGQGKQAQVTARTASQSFDTFLSFTRWVQSMGRTPGQRTIEVAKRTPPPEVAAALGIEVSDLVIQVTRMRLLDGTPALVERSTFIESVGRPLLSFDCDSGSIYEQLTEQGVDLSAARHTIDAIAADALDSELLGVDLGTPLLRERRLAGSTNGDVYEYADDRYRPDLVTFTIENASDHTRPSLSRTHP